MLLGLDDKWKPGLCAQQIVIEFGKASPCRAVPEMEIARHETLCDEWFNEAEPVNHLECRRMGRRRSRAVIYLRLSLQDYNGKIVLCARERSNDTNGTCACDDDA